MQVTPRPKSHVFRSCLRLPFPAILAAALIGGAVHAQGLLDKLKDRLGPAAGVIETVVENREAFQGFTEAEEIEIAQKNSAQFEAQTDLWDEPRLDSYLNGIVQRLAQHAQPRPFEYRLKVLAGSSINAMTFGGGFVYVNAGLLARMQNEAQVAMVLAHEVAHAAQSHVTEGMKADASINLLGQLAGQAVAASGRIDPEVLEKTYHYSMNAAINGHGRKQESEADELGLEYLVEAGYDPREASGTFEQLLKEYGDPSTLDAFFYSSHPRNEERMARATAWVDANVESLGSDLVVNTQQFQEATHAIVVAMGRLDFEKERFDAARAMFDKAVKAGVADPVPHYYLGVLALEIDASPAAADPAVTHLRDALAVDEAYAPAYRALGMAYDRKGDRSGAADADARSFMRLAGSFGDFGETDVAMSHSDRRKRCVDCPYSPQSL